MPEVHEPVLGCSPAGQHHLNGTLCAAADVHVYAYGTAAQDAAGGVRIDVGQVGRPPGEGRPNRAHLLAPGLLDAFAPEDRSAGCEAAT